MRKFLSSLFLILCLVVTTHATDITIPTVTLPNFQISGIGNNTTGTATATNLSATVTSSAAFPSRLVGLGGYKILLGGFEYEVLSTESTSSLTLTSAFSGSTGSTAFTIYPVVLLQIYSDLSYFPNGETYSVQAGSRTQPNGFFKRVGCSFKYFSGVPSLVIPQLTLDAISDAPNMQERNARLSASFFRVDGSFVRSYDGFESFTLTASPTTQTWADINRYNKPLTRAFADNSTLTREQIYAALAGRGTISGTYRRIGLIASTGAAIENSALYQDGIGNVVAENAFSVGGNIVGGGTIDAGVPNSALASLPAAPATTRRYKLTDYNRGFVYWNATSAQWELENPVFNAKDFGFHPSATAAANATAAAAIVAALPSSNAVIEIPFGEYSATAAILFNLGSKTNITIRGAGRGATKITFTGTGSTPAVFYSSGGSKVTIEGLTIAGTFHRGVSGASTTFLTVRDCEISGATAAATAPAGIFCDTCDDALFEKNFLSGNGNGSTVGGAAGGDIVMWRSSGSIGAGTAQQKRVKITGNTCTSTAGTFNIGTYDLFDSDVEGNFCEGAGAGTTVLGGYNIMVYRSNDGTNWTGVLDNVRINNNTGKNAAGIGIYSQGGTNKTFSSNIVLNPCQTMNSGALTCAGIVVEGGPATLKGNTVDGSDEEGIVVQGVSNVTAVAACPNDSTCDTKFAASSNTIRGSQTYAMRVVNGHGSSINANPISGNGRGLKVSNSANVSISVNPMESNGAGGFPTIEAEDSQGIQVIGNMTTSGGGHAIAVSSSSSGTPILNAQVIENKINGVGSLYRGITLLHVSGADVLNNQVGTSSGAEGIQESGAGSSSNVFKGNKVAGFTTPYSLLSTAIIKDTSFTYATRPTVANGSEIYCSDCTPSGSLAGSSTGAFLRRVNGAYERTNEGLLSGANITVGAITATGIARINLSSDGATQFGVNGLTKGVRVETSSSESTITGVDNTLLGSRQPLAIDGSEVRLNAGGSNYVVVDSTGLRARFKVYTFATLPTAAEGIILPCSDCTVANPTAGGGSGALVVRLGGVWIGK
jgi:Right handed beta helix region